MSYIISSEKLLPWSNPLRGVRISLTEVNIAMSSYERDYINDELNLITNIQDSVLNTTDWVDFVERDLINESTKNFSLMALDMCEQVAGRI